MKSADVIVGVYNRADHWLTIVSTDNTSVSVVYWHFYLGLTVSAGNTFMYLSEYIVEIT